jgi:hypothetical protein
VETWLDRELQVDELRAQLLHTWQLQAMLLVSVFEEHGIHATRRWQWRLVGHYQTHVPDWLLFQAYLNRQVLQLRQLAQHRRQKEQGVPLRHLQPCQVAQGRR